MITRDNEMKSAVKMMIDGMEMIIVVVWKKVLMIVPIPVMNM